MAAVVLLPIAVSDAGWLSDILKSRSTPDKSPKHVTSPKPATAGIRHFVAAAVIVPACDIVDNKRLMSAISFLVVFILFTASFVANNASMCSL